MVSCGSCLEGLATFKWRRIEGTSDHESAERSLPSLTRLRFLMRWARLQLGVAELKGNPDNLVSRQRAILDHVISATAPWAIRLKLGSDAKDDACEHLACLVRFLNKKGVADTLKATNELSVKEFAAPEGSHDPLVESTLRTWRAHVLPTLAALAEIGRPDEMNPGCSDVVAWSGKFVNEGRVRPRLGFLSRTMSFKAIPRDVSVAESFKSCLSDSSEHEVPPRGAEHEIEHASDSDIDGANMFRSSLSLREPGSFGNSLIESLVNFGTKPPSTWEFRKGELEHGWDEADATAIAVRGPTFFTDRNKLPSDAALLEVVNVDLFNCKEEGGYPNISSAQTGVVQELRQAGETRFLFVVNFCMAPLQISIVFAAKPPAAEKEVSAYGSAGGPSTSLLQRFVEDLTDKERNQRFKVIPWVREGPWIVQQAVGRTPAIIGKSLATNYYSEAENCFEVSIDVFSSNAARRVLGLLKGAAKALIIEVFFVLEAKTPEELPEQILGGFRVSHGDLTRTRGPL